jgi:hypothetical protein
MHNFTSDNWTDADSEAAKIRLAKMDNHTLEKFIETPRVRAHACGKLEQKNRESVFVFSVSWHLSSEHGECRESEHPFLLDAVMGCEMNIKVIAGCDHLLPRKSRPLISHLVVGLESASEQFYRIGIQVCSHAIRLEQYSALRTLFERHLSTAYALLFSYSSLFSTNRRYCPRRYPIMSMAFIFSPRSYVDKLISVETLGTTEFLTYLLRQSSPRKQ